MTTIVINAISVREGGSLVVLRELLAAMSRLRPQWQWHVLTNAAARRCLPDSGNTVFHVYAESRISGWRIRLWYESELPALLKQVRANLLFSQTNYLPFRRLPCPSLLLVQHAGHFSGVFASLFESSLKNRLAVWNWRMKRRWVHASAKRANALTVQTHALARQISLETGLGLAAIHVIPHGCGLLAPVSKPVVCPAPDSVVRVGYISKFGVQKNFEVVFAALALLRAQGQRLVLVLTLDEGAEEGAQVLAVARHHGVADLIENHGEIGQDALVDLYQGLHLFVFPSLCESFGFPLVEAMACGLPVLVADTDSNLEVAGAAGLPFPCHDAAALAALLARLCKDQQAWQTQARCSLEQSRNYSWQASGLATVQLAEVLMATVTRHVI